ncbi:hypothetical protein D9758_008016 [Tetrapyrgos nigripes]|uniref:Fungal lipase-type domain-containing protein n=1 Tax=Tetrapyrgos nigripes TaxID=182062 RepID=A0A8H5D0G4_9AGAR|nr:hypothetical protein D9758_008016 [Tetrapyrgos nigripes]
MFLKSFIVLLGITALVSGSPVNLSTRAIDQATFNDLTFYFQYASSAYADSCASPNGNTLITEDKPDIIILQFNNVVTDTQGFIARDDNRREIVVALRGSTAATDFLIDAEIALIPFVSPGVRPPAGSLAHTGFLTAWNSVAAQVLTIVRAQLAAHPGYSLVSTGHSLGGALSGLAGIALQQNFPNKYVYSVNYVAETRRSNTRRFVPISPTRMFTYGQPRTFNPTGALFINQQFGANAFRGVHTTDGVPTIIPTSLGYRHHGIEYWQNPDPASAQTTKKCAADGEDPTCSASIPSQGIDQAHLTYFGIAAGTAFC